MLRELVTKSPVLAVPLAVLFLFLIVFVGTFALTYRRRASAYDDLARLPLDEESQR